MNKENLNILQKVTIDRISKEFELSESLDGLGVLYQDIFGKAPYFEKFSPEEITEIFSEYVQKGMLFIAKKDGCVVGFGAALPIEAVPEIQMILERSRVNTDNSWYMADLGVTEDYRRRGLARSLVQTRIDNMPNGTTIIMRTSINNNASLSLYRSLGFSEVDNAFQAVEQTRVDGSISSDKRIFLLRTK